MTNAWWFWTIVGYLSGSIPFSLLLGLARGVDIRNVGSRNIGATNLGRTLGRGWGIAGFGLDVVKGLAPVLAAGAAMGLAGRWDLSSAEAWRWLAVPAAAVIGHVFPIWLGFRGGKGVATSLGVLLGFYPLLTLPGLGALMVWLMFLGLFRWISLASIAAALALPALLLLACSTLGPAPAQAWPLLLVTGLLALLVIVRHRGNIARLLAGTEPKIGGATRHTPRSA